MKCFLILSIFLTCYNSIAQKKTIDFSVLDKWSRITNFNITNNGLFCWYSFETKTQSKIIVESVDASWKREFPNAGNPKFTGNSRWIVFDIGDSVGIMELGTENLRIISGQTFKTPENDAGSWIAYLSGEKNRTLTLNNLLTKYEAKFPNVVEYYFDDKGKILLIQQVNESSNVSLLVYLDLCSQNRDTIFSTTNMIRNIVFDREGTQIAFFGEVGSELHKTTVIYYYKAGMDSAAILVDGNSLASFNSFKLGSGYNGFSLPKFSKDGTKYFFALKPTPTQKNISDINARVDVWNYKDKFLQSQQLLQSQNTVNKSYVAVVNIVDKHVFQVNNECDDFQVKLADEGNGDLALVSQINGEERESNWLIESKPSFYVVSTKNGSRKLIKKQALINNVEFSPSGKYLIYYDPINKSYYAYNIAKDVTLNITKSISVPLYDDEFDYPRPSPSFGIAGWLENDSAVFIYDRYDIWQVDPNAIRSPINITNAYGRKNEIIYRCINYNNSSDKHIFKNQDTLILISFNRKNKNNGFSSIRINQKKDPYNLATGPYIYFYDPNRFLPSPNINSDHADCNLPVKAKYTDQYIIQRMRVDEAPTLYSTKDFKNFTTLSDSQPQKNYNWLKTELIHWKTFDGKYAEGILYKPENFDIHRKYPIIFYLYEKDANTLNYFIYPESSNGMLNIPLFVSDGYLVFVPNIYYKIGQPGESVYNSVVSAADYFKNMPWIESSKMGLQGHSFGGYEVNYLITRTNLFSAAISCAGATDLVSLYGSLREGVGMFGGWSNQYMMETYQLRLAAPLWENSKAYIENSPIFYLNKITTPLLILHNKSDGSVPSSQGIELFTGLRRLKKKAWLLQYDNEYVGHILTNQINKLDFSIRIKEFFDHYLREAPAPKWMTDGVPAQQKGVETGLLLSDLNYLKLF